MSLSKTDECYACQYVTEIKEYDLTPNQQEATGDKSIWLCEVCAGSLIGKICRYPRQYSEVRRVLRTIGWCTNRILEELSKRE